MAPIKESQMDNHMENDMETAFYRVSWVFPEIGGLPYRPSTIIIYGDSYV